MKKALSLLLSLIMICSIFTISFVPAVAATQATSFSPRTSSPRKTGYFANYTENNCTTYAACRANEILGSNVFPNGNRGIGVDSFKDYGFPTGSTPKVGAIAVWSSTHVAIVESISGNTYTTSEGHFSLRATESGGFRNIDYGGSSKGTYFDNHVGQMNYVSKSYPNYYIYLVADGSSGGSTTAPTSANIAFDKTNYSLNDKMYVRFSSDTYVEKYKIQIWYGSELIYDYETSENSLELSCAHFGAGTFSAYVTAVNPLGYHTSSTVDFTIVSKPSNPQIAINNSIFSLSDMITVTASANGGIDYYGIQVWKGSTVVYQKEFIGHSINIPCSELGTGDFAAFVSCVNISGAINTDTVYFTITNSSACSHSYTDKVTKQATCTADGVRTYTCSTCGYSYTETINKLGHSWGTPTYKWSSDNKTCTATRTCTRDSSHIETQTVNTTSQVIKQPTTTATGTRKFTATFTNSAFATQTKNVSIPKLNEPVDDDIYFPDVSESSWYYDAVQYVAKAGFMSGYQNGKFGPGDNLKRQDFVVILANIADVNLSSYASMTPRLNDVKKGAYYAAAVNWAVDNGIIAGYANGNFGVNDPITREQVATILYRYMGEPSVSNVNSTLAKFSDSGRISTFAKKPVAWAIQNNIISGMADGRVAPTEGASRAQIASIIMRMDQKGMF